MTTFKPPVCETCKHLHRDEKGYSCNAFPDGVPNEIKFGDHDHKTPYPGDNGIQYEELE